jgi:hypothetical protein
VVWFFGLGCFPVVVGMGQVRFLPMDPCWRCVGVYGMGKHVGDLVSQRCIDIRISNTNKFLVSGFLSEATRIVVKSIESKVKGLLKHKERNRRYLNADVFSNPENTWFAYPLTR